MCHVQCALCMQEFEHHNAIFFVYNTDCIDIIYKYNMYNVYIYIYIDA